MSLHLPPSQECRLPKDDGLINTVYRTTTILEGFTDITLLSLPASLQKLAFIPFGLNTWKLKIKFIQSDGTQNAAGQGS